MEEGTVAAVLRSWFPGADRFEVEPVGEGPFYDVDVSPGPDDRGVTGRTFLVTVYGEGKGGSEGGSDGESGADGYDGEPRTDRGGEGDRDGDPESDDAREGDRESPGQVYVKFDPAATGEGVLIEPRVQRLVAAETYLPVARVLAVEDDPPTVPPYFVTERAPGESFEGRPGDLEPRIHEAVLRRAGRYLGELHESVAFDRVGSLRAVEEGGFSRASVEPTGYRGGWPGYFRALTGVRIARLGETPLADLAPAARAALSTAADRIPDVDPVLVHDDYRYANLLVDPETGEITAVLDWGEALSGDPLYGVAKAEHLLVEYYVEDPDRRRALRERLRAGYREVGSLDPGRYRRVRPLYALSTVAWQTYGFLAVVGNYPGSVWRPHARRFRERFEGILADLGVEP